MTDPMNFIFRRLWYAMTGWGSIGIVYGLTSSKDQASAFMLPPSAIDRWFGFNPDAIWLYLSFFALVPSAYLLCEERRLVWLARAMQLSALGAGAVFVFWPTTMAFPEITQTGLGVSMLRILIDWDSMQNCLPSLHVTLTLLSVWALWDRQRPLHNAFFALWGAAITVSILQLHRHQFIDLVCGALLAVCAGFIARMLIGLNRGGTARPAASVS